MIETKCRRIVDQVLNNSIVTMKGVDFNIIQRVILAILLRFKKRLKRNLNWLFSNECMYKKNRRQFYPGQTKNETWTKNSRFMSEYRN